MPREELLALAADARRLLASGGASASGDDRLRRRARALHELGQKAPALARVACAVERVADAAPESAAAALLDLLALLRPVCGALAQPGGAGELTEVEDGGPWESGLPPVVVYGTVEALATRGISRTKKVRNALSCCLRPDLRLTGSLLKVFEERNIVAAAEVAPLAPQLLGRAALPELRAALDFRGRAVGARRLLAICHIDGAAGLELCQRAFREGSAPVRLAALKGVVVAAPERAGAVLIERLHAETNSAVRGAAVQALGRQSETAGAAVPVLIELLGDKPGVAQHAANALARIGRPAVPALADALRSGKEGAGRWASVAVGALGAAAAEAAPALLDYLRRLRESGLTGHDFCRGVRTLGTVARDLPEAVPFLVELVKRGGWGQAEAVQALGYLAPASPEVAAALGELMAATRQEGLLHTALGTLSRLGPASVAAVPFLLPMLADRQAQQWAAADALALIGPHAPGQVVPGVVEALLKEENPLTRRRIIFTLRRIGPPAQEATLALSLFAESADNPVDRGLAAQALQVIRGLPATA
jgi:HEAT repeat protein